MKTKTNIERLNDFYEQEIRKMQVQISFLQFFGSVFRKAISERAKKISLLKRQCELNQCLLEKLSSPYLPTNQMIGMYQITQSPKYLN